MDDLVKIKWKFQKRQLKSQPSYLRSDKLRYHSDDNLGFSIICQAISICYDFAHDPFLFDCNHSMGKAFNVKLKHKLNLAT